MRVAVIDMGTNSTRLLVADVAEAACARSSAARPSPAWAAASTLSGQLSAEAIEDVCATVGDYIEIYRQLGPERMTAIATSAVRDAENGGAFIAELRERFALEPAMLDGEEEARLTYLGAGRRAAARPADRTLVIDIGGGSTELVVGSGTEIGFHTSLQAGTVRHSERHISHDPPTPPSSRRWPATSATLIDAELRRQANVQRRRRASRSPARRPRWRPSTSELDPYDPDAVQGHRLSLRRSSAPARASRRCRWRSASRSPGSTPTGRRRSSPAIVILIQVMRAFGLSEIEVSEHDILYGAALESAPASGALEPPAPPGACACSGPRG